MLTCVLQPRSLELFTHLGFIEPVMQQAILTPRVRMYRMPEGVEPSHEFEMSPRSNPTPTHPFVWLYFDGLSLETYRHFN